MLRQNTRFYINSEKNKEMPDILFTVFEQNVEKIERV